MLGALLLLPFKAGAVDPAFAAVGHVFDMKQTIQMKAGAYTLGTSADHGHLAGLHR